MPPSGFVHHEADLVRTLLTSLVARLAQEVAEGKYKTLNEALGAEIENIDRHESEQDEIPVVSHLCYLTRDFYLALKKKGGGTNKLEEVLDEIMESITAFKLTEKV